MSGEPRRLLGATEGSVFIELLILVPLLLLFWVLMNYVFFYDRARVDAQRHARECTWRFATSGCQSSPPPGCDPKERGTVDDSELRAAAEGAFDTVQTELPFTAPFLSSLHGDEVVMEDVRYVTRPKIYGGRKRIVGHDRMMCNDGRSGLPLPVVFELTCRSLLGEWCR